MRYRFQAQKRRGAVIPLVAICMVGLLAMVALAIDIGMIAVARTQAQNAADVGAMAGARTLDGDTANNNNYSNATPWAIQAAGQNSIFTNKIASGQCTIDVGSYYYDYNSEKFVASYGTKPASENWTLVRARVTSTEATAFAKVIGVNSFNVAATATAIHRPRDISVIFDIGGSMRYDSLMGIPHSGDRTAGGSAGASGSNNPETVFPKFGPYSDTTTAGLQRTTPITIGGEFYNLANITVETSSGPPIVDYFYQNNSGATNTKAFSPADDALQDTPGGDVPKKNGSTWVKTINDMTTADKPLFRTGGTGFGSNFYGYTQGPRYWGKTFFVWPPDPRTTAVTLKNQGGVVAVPDWRLRFFGTSINSKLWDTSGNWKTPNSNYTINYTEILKWIKQPYPDGTTLFPPRVRAGRIIYYDAIPDVIVGNNPTDDNQRFWKKYIDYVLGVYYSGSSYSVITNQTGYGSDFSWGTPVVGTSTTTNSDTDNPRRPRLHFWFGPMTMVDFLGNHNRGIATTYQEHYWLPGTCTEAPNYGCKLGIQAALQDIQRNHPNDYVSLSMFSFPKDSASDSRGRFNTARVGMGRNYQRLIDSLWFPQSTIDNPGTEIRFDTVDEIPRSFGGTCFAMGFMLTYNQFSSNANLRTSTSVTGLGGGFGRRGANKLVILETDGQVKDAASASWKDGGAGKSYYDIVPPSYPSKTGSLNAQVYDIVDRIVSLETSSLSGYGTKRKDVLIHTIAFGTIFEPYSTDPDKAGALALLQEIQARGKTQGSGPEADKTNASLALQSYKIITGTPTERVEKMRQAFSAIMQDGVQISLIE